MPPLVNRIVRALRAPELTAALAAPQGIDPTSPAASGGGVRPARQLASPWTASTLAEWVAADYLGAADAAAPLARPEAMSVPAVARARNLICGTVASVKLTAYTGERDIPATWVPLPVQPRWIGRTDSAIPPWHRMVWTVDDLLFSGFSLWRLTPDAAGELHADRVAREAWSFDQLGRVRIGEKLAAEVPGYANCLLICGPHEGLLTYAKRTIRHASNLLHAADRAAETPTPNLELHQTTDDELTDEEIGKLVSDWGAARRGANGGVAYTNRAIEVRSHGSFDAHLLIDGRNASAVDVARASNLPASLLDAGSEGTSVVYQNVRDNARQLVDQGVGLFMAATSGSLSGDQLVPAGAFVAFDLEAWLDANNPAPLAADPDRRDGASEPATDTEDDTP